MLDIQKRLTNSFYILLSLPATAMGFALCVQIAALSWILNTKFGLNLEDIGFVWLAGPLAGILGQPIVGLISDDVWFWRGRRRPFILIGGVLAALMILALPFIGVISDGLGLAGVIGVAIAVAISLDLAINISFNPTRSIIADVTPEGELRTKGYTWMQTVSGFFGVLAYLIGTYWDNYTLIYLGAILVFLFSIIPPFFIEEPRQLNINNEVNKSSTRTSWMDVLKTIQPLWGLLLYAVYRIVIRMNNIKVEHYWAEIICLILTGLLIANLIRKDKPGLSETAADAIAFQKILAAHAFTWLGVQTMFIYNFGYIKEVIMGYNISDVLNATQNDQLGDINNISFAILNTVGFLLPAFVLEPLAEKIGRVRTHILCLVVMTLGYAAIVFLGKSSISLFILMGIAGIGWAAVVSLPFAIMSEVVNPARMGLYMGLFNLSVVLPQLVASSLGGFIEKQESRSAIYIICAIALGISAILWLWVKDNKKSIKGNNNPVAATGGH